MRILIINIIYFIITRDYVYRCTLYYYPIVCTFNTLIHYIVFICFIFFILYIIFNFWDLKVFHIISRTLNLYYDHTQNSIKFEILGRNKKYSI